MNIDLKDAPRKTRGRLKNTVSLFIPKSTTSSRVNKTGVWRFARPVFQNSTAPCSAHCPAGNDIPKIEGLVAQKDIKGAFQTILKESPFPSTCGRVCFHPCEDACNRNFQDNPLAVHTLERHMGDAAIENQWDTGLKPLPSNGKKVAVLGAGPAGLSAAYFLTLLGFSCEIFESRSEPGGVLRWGIPSYRLPKEILKQEIQRILDLGVTLHLNHPLTPDFINKAQNSYYALFMAPGLSMPRPMEIPGEEFLMDGISFLEQIQTGSAPPVSGRIAVLGGGNTAVDVARSLKRLGARPVIVYRRRRQDMPAFGHEVLAAEEEGVEIMECLAPVSVKKNEQNYLLTVQEMEATGVDTQGRARMEPHGSPEESLVFSAVYSGIGARADEEFIAESLAGKNESPARMQLSHLKLWFTKPVVMLGGDPVNQNQSVAHAVASGKQAAIALHAYMDGGSDIIGNTIKSCRVGDGESLSMEIYLLGERSKRSSRMVDNTKINRDYFENLPRLSPPVEAPAKAATSFGEMEKGVALEEAAREAGRCYQCGYCNDCDTCRIFCPEVAIQLTDNGREFDLDYCKGCGVCSVECPRGVIIMEEEA